MEFFCMAKKYHASCRWAEEMKDGWKTAMKSRLKFHGALTVDMVATSTARSPQVVRNWFKKLVADGAARFKENDSDSILPELPALVFKTLAI